jgi:hypothetical protein
LSAPHLVSDAGLIDLVLVYFGLPIESMTAVTVDKCFHTCRYGPHL